MISSLVNRLQEEAAADTEKAAHHAHVVQASLVVFDHTCIGFFRNRCELAIGRPALETSNQIQGSCTLPVLGSPIEILLVN